MKTAAILAVLIEGALAAAASAAPRPPATEAPAVEFFEARVRPILANHCLSCHGDKKQKGGLRLDSRASALEGGEDGPALVAGQPDKSMLIHAVRRDGKLKMPPRKKLPPEAVATLISWVKMGAPWPETQGISTSRAAAWKQHWHRRPSFLRSSRRWPTPSNSHMSHLPSSKSMSSPLPHPMDHQ